MSLVIYIGHSGDRLTTDAARISSLEALRAFVEKHGGISAANQVHLTARGKQVRAQTLLTENELFTFDSSLLSPPRLESSSREQIRLQRQIAISPTPHDPGQPPDTLTNQTDLQSWQQLFTTRLSWAHSLRDACVTLASLAQKHAEERDVMEKSLGVAVMSLTSHMRGAEQKHAATQEWSEELLRQQEVAIDSWRDDLQRLGKIPGRSDFTPFVMVGDTKGDKRANDVDTLKHFVSADHVEESGRRAKDIVTSFAQRVVGLATNLTTAGKASDELLDAVEQMRHAGSAASSNAAIESAEEPSKLMDEIDIIVEKMQNDLEHVSSLPSNSQGASRASKAALLHTRNYLPNLMDFCTEINELSRRFVDARNRAAEASMAHMQTLAGIESRLSQIYSDIKNLDISAEDQDAFNMLNLVSRLPHVYGSLLIEAVRRREWVNKMKKDSATLAEEMATYEEEETRRRKKWLLSIDDVVNPQLVHTKPMGVEINLQSDGQDWPIVSRQEIDHYLTVIEQVGLPDQVVQDLKNAVKDLDRPTKKQVRLARNAFKNGSVYDAAFGTTSLMLRGGDEHKVLRDINAKLEDELRGQKSRVRKLEDLLHRQAHLQRVGSGSAEPIVASSGGTASGASVFSPMMELVSTQGTPPMSGMPFGARHSEDIPRHASIGSIGGGERRPSVTLAAFNEEKKLARRVVSLEAELQQSKEHITALEQEKHNIQQEMTAFEEERRQRGEDDGFKQAQLDEAVSTKKDIMKNMEAQQREFANERRVLEEELRTARGRLDEIEDEMERVFGSREHDDARAKGLEQELEQVRQHAAEEEEKKAQEIGELKEEIAEYRKRSQQWEERERETEQTIQGLKTASEEQRQSYDAGTTVLNTVHKHLSPCTQPPERYSDLTAVLENLAERSSTHVRELTDALELLKSEKESAHLQHEAQSKDLSALSAKHVVLEAEVVRMRDEMASEKAHAESLSSCLNDERIQLRHLRATIASGETGADVLRKRVEEEEGRVMQLTEKLAEAEAHGNSLVTELKRVQDHYQASHSELLDVRSRLGKRGSRAKEVSQKLYAQNLRFLRLLDQLGFVVSQNLDGGMMIERASKVNNAASTTLDASRTFSSPPPMPSRKTSMTIEPVDPSKLSFLHWPDAPDAATEEKAYASFLSHISTFDPSVFSESLQKRLRDFEYTARKWSKEARHYSSLSTRLRAESNAKIAVRDFKEGDLALFLPTRGELGNKGAWAAFNIGAPHHFLRERESMGLTRREWLVARIGKVEERVVDLKNPGSGSNGSNIKGSAESFGSIGSTSVDAASMDSRGGKEKDDDNPFELSDGLTWYLVHASEDKAAAPSTPGLGKVTVASSSVDAKGSIRMEKKKEGLAVDKGLDAVKTLGNVKSLDSRRSSEASKKSVGVGFLGAGSAGGADTKRVNSAGSSVKGLGIAPSSSPSSNPPAVGAGESDRGGNDQSQQSIFSSSPFKPRPKPHLLVSGNDNTHAAASSSSSSFAHSRRAQSPSKSIRSLARHLDPSASSTSSVSTVHDCHRYHQPPSSSSSSYPSSSSPQRQTRLAGLRTGGPPATHREGLDIPGLSNRSKSLSPQKKRMLQQHDIRHQGEEGQRVGRRRDSTAAGGGNGSVSRGNPEAAGARASGGNGKGGNGDAGSLLWNLFSVGGGYEYEI